LLLILGFLFLGNRSVFASGIQAGLVKTVDLPAWVCGKKVAVEDRARVSCGTARFHGCSDCDHTVAVMDNSPATIRINVELGGRGFTNEHAMARFPWAASLTLLVVGVRPLSARIILHLA
jgi:hypothetical protein